ncbi:hypothetical protein MSG28_006885 [Choristoneura fumiferana]|uniref:Uncharacterized protein n=1 Tax=Choristoneura fumiferana TaxID=7141 RepID=A0ACC0JLR2_CHOFU|nr:hypothetical protein MSG28_006885 [Choristoneura fumiferana]
MARGKGGKFNNRKKKRPLKPFKKNKTEVVNKKALFNRYKNKQKVEEENLKKEQLERKLIKQQVTYSESEEEEDPYNLLVSCFNQPKKQKTVAESDESDTDVELRQESDDEAMESESESADPEIGDKDGETEDIGSEQDPEDMEDEFDQASESDIKIVSTQEIVNEEQYSSNDPFIKHLHYELGEDLLVSLSNPSPEALETVNKTWPILGNLVITIPKPVKIKAKVKSKVSLLEEKTYAAPGAVPQIASTDFQKLFIKSQIHGNIVSANKTNLIKKDLELTEMFTPLQREIFGIINNYQDLYYPERNFTNSEEIRYIYCLHVVNHMLKTRTKILHHNAKLSKKTDPSEEYRDQGLVRPKVLILVPFKNAAYKVVKTLMEILVPKEAGQVVNKNRFEEDFTGGELLMPQKNPKPEDYELMFSGNTEDTFRLAMTLTKKTLKLYTDFYSSDIIVASPLGLRMIVGAEGEEDRDYDFLASIEVLVLDQADVVLMQNWDHLLHCLDHFHLQPQKTRDTDFSRVRSWAINGWSKYYRRSHIHADQSTHQDESNEPKLDAVASFNYPIPMVTFQLHHQTLVTI